MMYTQPVISSRGLTSRCSLWPIICSLALYMIVATPVLLAAGRVRCAAQLAEGDDDARAGGQDAAAVHRADGGLLRPARPCARGAHLVALPPTCFSPYSDATCSYANMEFEMPTSR